MSTQKSKTSGRQAEAKSGAHPTKRTSHSGTSNKKTLGNKKWLMYGGIAAAAATVYGISRIPVVRTMVLPMVAAAVTKNWGTIRASLKRG